MMKQCTVLAVVLVGIFLTACSKASVIPLSADMFQVVVEARPNCGPTGAQKFAVDTAAVATIEKGFDRFLIVSYSDRSVASGAVAMPTMTAVQPGGFITGPSIMTIPRRHHSTVQARMFRHGDAGSEQAIDARRHLGPDWQKKVKRGVSC